MATITIGGNDFDSYSTLAEADIYFIGSTDYTTWQGYTDAQKERGLISASRLLDRQSWLGSKTDEDQTQAFPRDSLSDCEGNELTSAETLEKAVEASQLLALSILGGSTVTSSATTEDLTKRLKADTVEIEYFRKDKSEFTRFSQDVMELMGCFLANNGTTLAGSIAYGTDGTALDNDFSVSLGA